MNSKVYRCGWCGTPTNQNGTTLHGQAFEKVVRIIDTYGDGHTEKTHGDCCRYEGNAQKVTRDMAIDAGDLSLEGQII